MWQAFGKTVLAISLPIMITKTLDFISDGIKSLTEEDKPEPAERSKHDFTKLTQFHYDYIVQAFAQHNLFNAGKKRVDRETQITLVNRINAKMSTDKSRASLARIWNGNIKRKELPAGEPYFDYDI